MNLEQIEAEWLKGCDHVDGARSNPELCERCAKAYQRAKDRSAERSDPEKYERDRKKDALVKNGWVGGNGHCPSCDSGYLEINRTAQVRVDVDRFGNRTRWIGADSLKLVCLDCGFEGPSVVPEMNGTPSETEIAKIRSPFMGVKQ